MSEEKSKSSVWTWLLPMIFGALISIITDQLSEWQQAREARTEKEIAEARRHFFAVSELTGELYATTFALLEELSEEESSEIEVLNDEYKRVLVKLNMHQLQFISIVSFHFGEDRAKEFEDRIIVPLRSYHQKIDHCLINKKRLEMSAEDHEELFQLRDRIIRFNEDFLSFIQSLK